MVERSDVVVALTDGVVLLDVAGPVQVLHWAGRRVRFASPDGRPVRSDVGVPLGVEGTIEDFADSVDTLLVPGIGVEEAISQDLVRSVRAVAGVARRVASICTGAFVLAEAGLLDGRRATTHWMACTDLAQRFPEIEVDPDAIFVRDGTVITSAGVTAGIDLALALVEEDEGADVARSLAKYLVVFLRRPGGQSQFSVRTGVGTPRTSGLRRVIDAVVADPSADHSLAAMAARATVGERQLTRLFRKEIGTTPAQYVERVRVEAAQRLLQTSDDPVAPIARRCGFGSEETMRRVFGKVLGTSPTDYRARFRAPSPAAAL
ncbi:GlxA family transcriptional regulator [Nocardia uniformis]|uniref:GlxA family transcriptional regulator n=1 Tax=Nocardia uniformis TaxID=53432 RepID=A0A849C5M9_9NOCA|nr:GlxA family transcriptional regulator [Nocardia uniformis]